MSRPRSKPSTPARPATFRAEHDAFVAGLTAIGRQFGVAVAASGGIRLARQRREFARVTYLAHLPSGHLEPCFPGDHLDTVCGRVYRDRGRQAQFDAFLACLAALTQQFGVVLYPTGGVYLAARPGDFATLAYVADLANNRLEPRFPDDGKGPMDEAPRGSCLRIGAHVAYALADGRSGRGLVQGWRQGRVVIRHRLGHTEDVPAADCRLLD